MLPQRLPHRSERTASAYQFEVPASIIENASLLTPAETLLVLAFCRIGVDGVLKDSTWTQWTGKKGSIKRAAIRGLRKRGCLDVRGIGDRAKYFFDREKWGSWLRSRPREEKARTEGRSKSVTAKGGMQVHQECRERGCQKLCSDVIPIDSICSKEIRQPVGNSDPPKPPPSPPPLPLTLSALRSFFPHVEPDFVEKLWEACQVAVKVFTDEQLAESVHRAYTRAQQKEGLFLKTVPGNLRVVTAKPASKPPVSADSVRAALSTIGASLRKQQMDDLATLVYQFPDDAALAQEALWELQPRILERLRQRTPVSVFKSAVEKELKSFAGKMSRDQIERLEQQLTDNKLLEAAGIRLNVL